MESVTIEDLRLYCRVDEEAEDILLSQHADAAESKLTAAGIPITDRNRDRYALAVKAMTLHFLDHPGDALPQGIREMINDLKFTK